MRSHRWIRACLLLALAGTIMGTEPELQWPWWRGPYSNGVAVPSGGELVARPRLLWHSTEFTKQTGGTITGNGLSGGCQSLVMHDDKVYCAYFVGSQDPVVLDARRVEKDPEMEQARKLIKGGARHSNGTPLTRVGLDDPEVVQRLLWNVHGEDVMVCFDAGTGKVLWKTAVPGAIHNTGATYGPHLTPAVDPTTGRVYSVGVDGRIMCFDGETGEHLWSNEDRLTVDRAKAIEARRGQSCNRGRYEHVVAVDGIVVVNRSRSVHGVHRGDGTLGLDGATGEVRWTTGGHWLWLPWRHEGRWYLINGGTRCLDPQTGKDLWRLTREEAAGTQTGEYNVAITLHEDLMICGNACYRISPEGRELVWRNQDLITKSIKAGLVMDGVYYTSAFDPANTPKARAKLEQDFESGSKDPKDTRRRRRWLQGHLQELAAHHKQGGHLVGLSLEDGSPVHLSPPFGPGDTGGLLVGMDGWAYWKTKGSGGYHWLDVDAPDMGIGNPPDRAKDRLEIGHPDGSQTPACYKGRMYVRSQWSVACLDFTRP